jgi:hypothetical protein
VAGKCSVKYQGKECSSSIRWRRGWVRKEEEEVNYSKVYLPLIYISSFTFYSSHLNPKKCAFSL